MVEYDNEKPTYTIYNNSANGKIVSSRDATFIRQVENSTPSSRVDDVEERNISEDLDNLYHDGIKNLEPKSSDLDSSHDGIESKGSGSRLVSDSTIIHQYNRMTLRSSKSKSKRKPGRNSQ